MWALNNTGQNGGFPDADIDAPEAWSVTHDTTLVVGVIDTGIDYTHEDLVKNMWQNPGEIPGDGIDNDGNGFIDDVYGWDFANDDADPFDDHGHGTHVAGTVSAEGNNGIGVVGVNWSGKVAAIKFLTSGGSGSISDAISAVMYANMMGFSVTNNSWGGGGFSQALYDAISAANDSGYLFIAAAGNSGLDADVSPMYPAAYDLPNIISAAATTHTDERATFSNYGANSVDLGAPGQSILSSVPIGSCSLCDPSGYRLLSGTSMASPHVAGAAALLWSWQPTLTHLQTKDKILKLSEPIDALQGITVSGGRLNIYNFFDPDSTPPSSVQDLSVSKVSFNSATLSWTSVGDDGNSGTASFYDVRYSTMALDDATWQNAPQASGEPKPKNVGSLEQFTVNGLSESQTYYFGIKVRDNVGNESFLSNIVSATTPTPTLVFSDDMESGVNGWTADGLWHQETYRSNSPVTSWAYNAGAPDYNYDTGTANSGSLTSPVIDTSNLTSATLKFSYWYQTETSSATYDQRWIHVLKDGLVVKKIQLSGDQMNVWNGYALDISDLAGSSNIQVRFFFDTIDSILNSYEGWYTDDVTILGELSAPNNPPVADADGPYAGNEDETIVFDGSGSFDDDGDPLFYFWDFGDGTFGQGVSPSHVYTKGGVYTVTLFVNDGKEDSLLSSTFADIVEINDPPTANAGQDQAGKVGETLTFDGSGSFDEEGQLSYF